MKLRSIVFTIVLTLALTGISSAQQAALVPTASVRAEKFQRTELYLGMSIPGGTMVSSEAWEKFLSEIVTPLFPDGFTVLDGRGQYREASGAIAKEPSHVLVFLYRKGDRKAASVKIERIRSEYKRQFSQESVLRVDITKSMLVSF